MGFGWTWGVLVFHTDLIRRWSAFAVFPVRRVGNAVQMVLYVYTAAHWEAELDENDSLHSFKPRDVEEAAAVSGVLSLEEAQ